MENYLQTGSVIWDDIVRLGSHLIQSLVYKLTGHELSPYAAVLLLICMMVAIGLAGMQRLTRPRKTAKRATNGHGYTQPYTQ